MFYKCKENTKYYNDQFTNQYLDLTVILNFLCLPFVYPALTARFKGHPVVTLEIQCSASSPGSVQWFRITSRTYTHIHAPNSQQWQMLLKQPALVDIRGPPAVSRAWDPDNQRESVIDGMG